MDSIAKEWLRIALNYMRDRRAESYSEKAESLHGKRWDREEAQILSLLTVEPHSKSEFRRIEAQRAAEPEPCDSARMVAMKCHAVLSTDRPATETIKKAGGLVESYSSTREQAARADERRRCAESFCSECDKRDDAMPYDHPDRCWRRAAILQGTKPAKEVYVDTKEHHFGEYADYWNDERKAEPAKVSDDVESLIPKWEDLMITYNQAISIPIESFSDESKLDRFRGWRVLRDRLVSRLKEGTR